MADAWVPLGALSGGMQPRAVDKAASQHLTAAGHLTAAILVLPLLQV